MQNFRFSVTPFSMLYTEFFGANVYIVSFPYSVHFWF